MHTLSLRLPARLQSTQHAALLGFALALCGVSPAVLAQSAKRAPTVESVELAGSTRAFSVMCGETNETLLDASREQQKAQAAKAGISSERFDAAFAAGEEEVKSHERTMSPQEKNALCEEERMVRAKGNAAVKAAQSRR